MYCGFSCLDCLMMMLVRLGLLIVLPMSLVVCVYFLVPLL